MHPTASGMAVPESSSEHSGFIRQHRAVHGHAQRFVARKRRLAGIAGHHAAAALRRPEPGAIDCKQALRRALRAPAHTQQPVD
jgi:hypothetical protein